MTKKKNGSNGNGQVKTEYKLLREFKPKTRNQAEYVRAIAESEVVFCTGPAGTGKAQPLYSIVYTPSGPKTMGDLDVGDLVCTPSGSTAKIIKTFNAGIKNIVKITFSDGNHVMCCDEHLWLLYSEDWKQPKVIEIKNIIDNYKRPSGKRKYYIQLTSPVKFNKQIANIDPYLLGLLLGDGCLCKDNIFISSDDNEIIQYIINLLGSDIVKHTKNYDYRLLKTNLDKHISAYGLCGTHSNTKFIPKIYLFNDFDTRLSILQGLLDADGSCSNGIIEYTTCSLQLAKDVQFLVQSLGGICRVTDRIPQYIYKNTKLNGQKSYRLYIRFDNNIIPFKLTRKKSKITKRTKYFPKLYIDNIEYVGKEECKCILIDSEDHLYLTDNFYVTHNTAVAVGLACEHLVHGKVNKIVITRPVVEAGGRGIGYLPGTANDKLHPYLLPILDEMSMYFTDFEIQKLMHTNTIEVAPLQFMRGRNFHRSFMILDEAQNASFDELKMFITRLGNHSKCIVNGDLKQSDLVKDGITGLHIFVEKLADIDGVAIQELTAVDIVRNPIISKILEKLDS